MCGSGSWRPGRSASSSASRRHRLTGLYLPARIGLLTAGTLAGVLLGLATGTTLRAWPMPLAILAAGWWGARAAESRVFGAVLLWWGMLV